MEFFCSISVWAREFSGWSRKSVEKNLKDVLNPEILKGTVSVISSDSPRKGDNGRWETVPFKALSDQVRIRFQCLQFWKQISFNCGFSTKVSCLCISIAGNHIGTILNLEHVNNFYSIDQIKVSRVPLRIVHCHIFIIISDNMKMHWTGAQEKWFNYF